eukprot:365985-Chlamydomonas_euryale.AAC.12
MDRPLIGPQDGRPAEQGRLHQTPRNARPCGSACGPIQFVFYPPDRGSGSFACSPILRVRSAGWRVLKLCVQSYPARTIRRVVGLAALHAVLSCAYDPPG